MTQKNINEIMIKISGKFPIEKDLELGQEVLISLKGGVVKQEVNDNQDGTVDVTYVIKPLSVSINENNPMGNIKI